MKRRKPKPEPPPPAIEEIREFTLGKEELVQAAVAFLRQKGFVVPEGKFSVCGGYQYTSGISPEFDHFVPYKVRVQLPNTEKCTPSKGAEISGEGVNR